MSEENVEIVRQALDALNRRDADALLEAAVPEFVQDWSRSISPDAGIFRGQNQVRQFLQSWWEAFDETFVDVEELIETDHQVVAVFRARNRGRGSGAEVQGRGAVMVWALREGKIVSVTLYQERAEALEAVGLPG